MLRRGFPPGQNLHMDPPEFHTALKLSAAAFVLAFHWVPWATMPQDGGDVECCRQANVSAQVEVLAVNGFSCTPTSMQMFLF